MQKSLYAKEQKSWSNSNFTKVLILSKSCEVLGKYKRSIQATKKNDLNLKLNEPQKCKYINPKPLEDKGTKTGFQLAFKKLFRVFQMNKKY